LYFGHIHSAIILSFPPFSSHCPQQSLFYFHIFFKNPVSLSERRHVMISSSINFILCSWIILHCAYIPHFLYSLICWWAPKLITRLGYCESCHSKHRYAGMSVVYWLTFLWVWSGLARSYHRSIFSFSRTLPTSYFHRGYTNLHCHQQFIRISFSLHSH
jgi:hypothetical protein